MKVNVPASEILAQDLYLKGRKIEKEEHAVQDLEKQGTLRGGSVGCVTDNGEIQGTCHRIALARLEGLQAPIEETSYTWFDAGYANETAWMRKLSKSVGAMPDYTLKSEEECPLLWEVDGVSGTGRPDIMIFNKEKPVLGLELKVICAVNASIGVWCEDKPKVANLIQAANYSRVSGCPFNLVYSFRSRSNAPGWAGKFKDKLTVKEKVFPPKMRKDGTYGKEFIKRDYIVEPFIKEFRIGFEDDRVYYIKEDGVRVDTPITAQGIHDYYQLILNMRKDKDLHIRISNLDLAGQLLPYDPCNYCQFKDACDDFENDYESWFDKVALICQEEK